LLVFCLEERVLKMDKSNVEIIFNWLDETTNTIQQHENEPYLDSLSMALETLFFGETSPEMDDLLTHKLEENLKSIHIDTYNREQIRKAIQLAILKGMKDSTQQHHLMTPETVALLVKYLVEKLTANKETFRMFDPVCGTGNLLLTVVGTLEKQVEAFASEIDGSLLHLALASANLQKIDVEFFQQDSLRPFLLDPVDVVVADLPVGYYPDDIRATEFELKADEGHSYAHHLLIEQSMNYTQNGGYLVLIVPDTLFESDQADKLHAFIHNHAHIVGLLQLPETIFKSKQHAKSILILQKKGVNTNAPKQPLLVKLPSLKNTVAMEDILRQMNNWFSHNQLNS